MGRTELMLLVGIVFILKRVGAVRVDMSEAPIKLCGILTLLHMSKYYAPLLHFKLKTQKAFQIYLYSSASDPLRTHRWHSTAAKPRLGSRNTQDFVTDENFRLTRRSTHPRSSALIRERDNC